MLLNICFTKKKNSFVRSRFLQMSSSWHVKIIIAETLWWDQNSNIFSPWLLSYFDHLLHYNMSSLNERRQLRDCLLLQKVLNGHIHSPGLLACITLWAPFRIPRLGTYHLCHLNLSMSNLSQHSPLNRVSTAYNKFIAKLKIVIFKTNLKLFIRLLISAVAGNENKN